MGRRQSYEEKIAEHIATIVRDRQIELILHFTPLENLPNILAYGLRSRSELMAADLGRVDKGDSQLLPILIQRGFCGGHFDTRFDERRGMVLP